MVLEVQAARAALAGGRTDEAANPAARLLARFGNGVAPDGAYRANAFRVAAAAQDAVGYACAAAPALPQGTHWIRHSALPYVPAAFVDSFLRRNPVNRLAGYAALTLRPVARIGLLRREDAR